jgi:uncharacterized membrane protein
MSNFLEDVIINKLNGYYLLMYANDRKISALCIYCLNKTFVHFLVLLRLIPPRIKNG